MLNTCSHGIVKQARLSPYSIIWEKGIIEREREKESWINSFMHKRSGEVMGKRKMFFLLTRIVGRSLLSLLTSAVFVNTFLCYASSCCFNDWMLV